MGKQAKIKAYRRILRKVEKETFGEIRSSKKPILKLSKEIYEYEKLEKKSLKKSFENIYTMMCSAQKNKENRGE